MITFAKVILNLKKVVRFISSVLLKSPANIILKAGDLYEK